MDSNMQSATSASASTSTTSTGVFKGAFTGAFTNTNTNTNTGTGSAASASASGSAGTDLQRPNSELSEEEKNAKRDLKRLLKRQTRRRKLEMRFSQAIARKQHDFAEQARADLEAFLLEEEPDESCQHQPVDHQVARDVVESIYHKLQASLRDNNHTQDLQKPAAAELKVLQTEQARTLLMNMTKGSQTESMFENEAALRGYTRQKFIERAMLMVTALTKLESLPESSQDRGIHERIRDKLRSVRSLASVGCGPGCDAVGVAAWLSSIHRQSSPFESGMAMTTKQRPVLDYAVLLDYAVQHWDRILTPLVEVVVPEIIGDMVTASCDVRSALTAESSNNAVAAQLLSPRREEAVDGTGNDNDTEDSNSQRLKVDLVVTSYLLSETRGQWHAFFDDLVRRTDPGTLFIFSDPTAWQLHLFMERSSYCMDFCWLDSSMHRPELQALEGRVGPAVLVGIKRE
jgi:hypothetical protein